MEPTPLKKLSEVQLLIELEETNGNYDRQAIEEELRSRDLSPESLKIYTTQRDYVLKQRAKKENESLSPLYILRLLITPFGIGAKALYQEQSSMEANEDFLRKAGYERKIKEIRMYRVRSIILWSLIFLTLLIYASFV